MLTAAFSRGLKMSFATATITTNPSGDIAAFLGDAIGIIKEMSRDATNGQWLESLDATLRRFEK